MKTNDPDVTHDNAAWGAVWALAFGVASLTAAEMLPISLRSSMAADLAVSQSIVGQAITAPAVVALAASLLVPVAIRGLNRHARARPDQGMLTHSERTNPMRLLAATLLSLTIGAPAMAQGNANAPAPLEGASSNSVFDIEAVSPALARYAREDIVGSLWQRRQLSKRDRSLVTVSVLVARNETVDLAHYLNVALDSGVTPAELSEAVTHLAFYAGWSSAMSAVAVAKEVFSMRGIGADQLPQASPELLPLNEESEATRQASVEQILGTASPGLDQFTTDPLFVDVWLRPGLSPRDRSLVTITSIMANGQVAQLKGHLNRALDNGLTKEEAGEVVTQVAFYAGWPNAFSAGPVAKEVFESRPD